MEELRQILSSHELKKKEGAYKAEQPLMATYSEIPDLFFDEVLVVYKLSRLDITVLMYLYRQVWCRPNLYRDHGIGPIQSYQEMSQIMSTTPEELMSSLRVLESYGFIETIRAGQYFVRKFFTPERDALFGQTYQDFV